MRDLMHRLTEEGKTVFISSHLLTEVQQICTRVAIINLGKLVTETTVEQLLTGRGAFIVTVERAKEALALVKAKPWGSEAYLAANGAIITLAPQGRGRELNLFLANAGFVADTITPSTEHLEQVSLRLTNSGSGEVQ